VSDVGSYFLENFELFAADRIFGIGKPGDVAARPREARNKPLCHRVGDLHEYDWHCAGRLNLASQMSHLSRPPRGQQRDKPYREALRMDFAAAGAQKRVLR